MDQRAWLIASGEGITVVLHVQPGARRTELAGEHGGALKIRLAAPAVDGRANDELIAFLASVFGVPKRQVELLTGQKSRNKRVRITRPTRQPALDR